MSQDALTDLINRELVRQVDSRIVRLAAQLAQRAGTATAAVLLYGSNLRSGSLEGVLDFYVLVDRADDWPASRLSSLAGRWLPPNVGYMEAAVDGESLRAKFAVMTVGQFRAAMSPDAVDTTLWARFSQPCAAPFLRSAEDGAALASSLHTAVVTAAYWAALIGPARGSAHDFWLALYRHTYDAELRVERSGRSTDLVGHAPERYAQLLTAAWREAGIKFAASPEGELCPDVSDERRTLAGRRWALRHRLGKPLNLLRLAKAAFTFDNAMDYVAWKVERQSGVKLDVKPWQRRHPLLAAPGVYLTLRKRGVL